MTNHPNRSRKTVAYSVRMRSGLSREYTRKDEAIRAARDEVADGWPSKVIAMRTGEIVWQPA